MAYSTSQANDFADKALSTGKLSRQDIDPFLNVADGRPQRVFNDLGLAFKVGLSGIMDHYKFGKRRQQ
jgi:hypothetical protein